VGTDQLAALVAIRDRPLAAVEIATRWTSGRPGGPPPGGAGFANLLAVARIKGELERAKAASPSFESIRVDRAAVNTIAQQLAEASVSDPSDVEVVENLAVLFAYLGDERRRRLARAIAESLKARAP
jgi:hypothetical protein